MLLTVLTYHMGEFFRSHKLLSRKKNLTTDQGPQSKEVAEPYLDLRSALLLNPASTTDYVCAPGQVLVSSSEKSG